MSANLDLRYLGKSGADASGLRFAPNLARPAVFYDAALSYPLRFREAISALHDVVVGDHRFQKRDKTAYRAWLAEQQREEALLRQRASDAAYRRELEERAKREVPGDLEAQFRAQHARYWRARRQWASELARHDPELFRHLVPCDPVVTVAPDVVFFECFSKDEASYGCLQLDRNALTGERAQALGTTNVDYSLALYEHFQTLRTYRPTRIVVDPTGFEVQVQGQADYREEKIDLPPSWLRGFGQISASMALPSRTIHVATEAVYSLLAYLKRHREKTGPRSLRVKLVPGRSPVLVLDPWGVEIDARGPVYDGPVSEEVKLWGRRRLLVLARLLPLAERFELRMLGTGLPHVWVAHLGELRFTLALSGWTTNDWSSGANLELLAGGFRNDDKVLRAVGAHLREHHTATLSELATAAAAAGASTAPDALTGAVYTLARQGQAVCDFTGASAGSPGGALRVRHRSILPVALSEALWGGDHPELVAARAAWRNGKVKLARDEDAGGGRRLLVGRVETVECEALLDGDGVFSQAKCSCSFFFKARLRAGPCRHLLALRLQSQGAPARDLASAPPWFQKWYASLGAAPGAARRS